ncbi:MAG: ribonuclease HIII [Simkania negevensis]|nr:ribonuclease HIII [Simkania negevensis]
MSCFVTQINLVKLSKLKQDLTEQGFLFSIPEHTIFQAKKDGLSCTLYKSGKMTVQGKGKDEFITNYLEPEILENLSYSYPEAHVDKTTRIGVDEAGKGDIFGPLCICALYADPPLISALIKMGVKDSKKMSDLFILKLANQIKKTHPHALVQINPAKYNKLYESFGNLNQLLAWGHATAIEELAKRTHCFEVIIDQFANETVVEKALAQKKLSIHLTQRHRGEEDVVVAAASILARASFVEGLEKLSASYSQKFPKGATHHIEENLEKFIAMQGKEHLHEVAKLHFKTVQQVLASR